MKSLLYHAFGCPCKRGRGSHSVARVSYGDSPPALLTSAVPMYRPCISSSERFVFCWAAFLSISRLASVFPVSLFPHPLPLFPFHDFVCSSNKEVY